MYICVYHACVLYCHELAETIVWAFVTCSNCLICKRKWALVLTLLNTIAQKCNPCLSYHILPFIKIFSYIACLPSLPSTCWPTHNIESLQILLDHPQPPLPYPYKDIRHIAPSSWHTTTWESLNDIEGFITFTDPWNLPLDYQDNCHIMPKVLSQLGNIPKPLLSKPDLKNFNLCQIYLQTLTLLDIATSSGKEIDLHIWKGHRSSCKSSLTWPHLIRPSSAWWVVWHKTLHLLFTDSVRSTKILPQYCLHSWYPKAPSHQLWPTFINPSTSILYTRLSQHNSFRIYSH